MKTEEVRFLFAGPVVCVEPLDHIPDRALVSICNLEGRYCMCDYGDADIPIGAMIEVSEVRTAFDGWRGEWRFGYDNQKVGGGDSSYLPKNGPREVFK